MNTVKNQHCRRVFSKKGAVLRVWKGEYTKFHWNQGNPMRARQYSRERGSLQRGQGESEVLSHLFPLGLGREDFNLLCKYRIALNNIASFSISFYSKQKEPGKAPNINILLGPVSDVVPKWDKCPRKDILSCSSWWIKAELIGVLIAEMKDG